MKNKNKTRRLVSFLLTGAMALSLSSSAFAVAGHASVAAVGTTASNNFFTTSSGTTINYQSSYSFGQTHAQIAVLKQNLKNWRAFGTNENYFTGVAVITSTNGYFDQATKDNLKVFQTVKGLTSDGIYGAGSRNAFHGAFGGISPKGYVRVTNTLHYINYNDTIAGLSGDASYKLDHSWITPGAKTTLDQLASSFYTTYSKKLEINDGSLIDGVDTPEHEGHMDGKRLDVRNNFGTTAMTSAQEKKFLEICVANSNVSQVIFYTKHGLTSSKIVVQADHADHFHVDFN